MPLAALGAYQVLRSSTTLLRVVLPLLILGALGTSTFLQTGYWRDATTLFERAVHIDPDNYMAHFQSGMAHWEARRIEEAGRHLQKAVEGRPQQAEAWNILGVIHDMRREEDRAMDCWRRALAIDPELRGARVNLRRALERKRKK